MQKECWELTRVCTLVSDASSMRQIIYRKLPHYCRHRHKRQTSVTNYLCQLFQKTGANVITNHAGNNLDTGICSLLLQHCNWCGQVQADYLVLETDESHVPVVYDQLKLETLIVLNFFRDQLDRNGEVETLIRKVSDFCKTFNGNLILNGDDPNTARLGRANPHNPNVKYFHVDHMPLPHTPCLKPARESSVHSAVPHSPMTIISILISENSTVQTAATVLIPLTLSPRM